MPYSTASSHVFVARTSLWIRTMAKTIDKIAANIAVSGEKLGKSMLRDKKRYASRLTLSVPFSTFPSTPSSKRSTRRTCRYSVVQNVDPSHLPRGFNSDYQTMTQYFGAYKTGNLYLTLHVTTPPRWFARAKHTHLIVSPMLKFTNQSKPCYC